MTPTRDNSWSPCHVTTNGRTADLVRKVFEGRATRRVVVVDDNSPDGPANGGRAGASMCGSCPASAAQLGWAAPPSMHSSMQSARLCVRVLLDADGSHDPRKSRRCSNGSQPPPSQPDIVIGSRYVPGADTIGWPRYRRWMSRGINAFARLMLGLPCATCSVRFRCIRVAMLERLTWDRFAVTAMPAGESLAIQTGRCAVRRDPDRVCQPPAGHVEDQHAREPGSVVDGCSSRAAQLFRI